jgi:WD40 repeat protein
LKGCRQTALSPDGRFLACYDGALDLVVYNVASGQPVLERKTFYEPRTFREFLSLYLGQLQDDVLSRILTMRFSPDSRYFIASSHFENTVALDLTTLKTLSLPESIKKLLSREFVFMGADRIAGVDTLNPKKSAIVRFPTGEMVEEFPLGTQNLEAAAHGNYLMLRPIDKYAMGVMDLETKKIFMADKESAFDIFDTTAVVERLDGEIALKQMSTNQQISKVNLPRSPLAPLRATAVSPDMKWLAVSERSRGGVWDLTKNERPFYVRGFTGAYFGADGALYADFPKFEETGRAVAQLNLAAHTVSPAFKLEEEAAHQHGPIMIVTKPNGKNGRLNEDVTLDVRDSVTGKSLWTRQFPKESPRVFVAADSSTLTLLWRLSTGAASFEMKADDDLAKRAGSVRRDEANFLVEIVDGHTGKSKGGFAIDTNKGAFDIRDIFAVGNRVVISDSLNRVLVYSAATGEQSGKAFGRSAESCGASGLIAAENEAGQLLFYDVSTMEKRDELRFNSPISMKRFSDDGKRLFVLTASQTAYIFDVAALSKAGTPANGSGN